MHVRVWYDNAEDPNPKALVKQPVAAQIEKVCDEGGFGLLGVEGGRRRPRQFLP